ncbi:MAG TPA: asparagine synthase (glutamine-hydrolyzing) [Micromonosporaceae bacterium]
MCGIAGLVDFDRDVRTARPLLQAMTDTMSCRGPDDEGLWLDAHVGFGHRRLAVIDIEGGRQPMVADTEGRAMAVLTYSGEIYNFRELREELVGYGHHFRTRSDTEVVLRAYLQWGESFVDHLNGMYAFGIWDAREERLILVRDRMGIKPLYYSPQPHGVLFGSEPKAILAHPDADHTIDEAGIRELFGDVKAPGAAVFRNMPELRPAHVLIADRDGIRVRRYWGFEAREHEHDQARTIATVRGLLEDIVDRQIISDVPLCTLLSGGLDSSTLTALAARSLAPQGQRVRSFAVDFVDHVENFTPDVIHPVPDAPYVDAVAAHVNAEHRHIVLDSHDMTGADVRHAVVKALDWPTFLGSMDISLYLLFKAIREHSTVALTGESADELFGGYPWFHFPVYTQSGTLPWTLAHNLGVPTLFGPLFSRIDLLNYQRDQLRQAFSEVPRMPGEEGHPRRMREFTHYFLTRFLRVLLDRKDRLSMAVGLEVRVPFCDHRLMEYVYNVPWAFKSFDGKEKSLLRAAVSDLLPQVVLDRPKSGYPVSQDPAYDRTIREELAKLLVDDHPPVEPLLHPAVVRAIRKDPLAANDLTRIEVDQALHLNDWLVFNNVRLDF